MNAHQESPNGKPRIKLVKLVVKDMKKLRASNIDASLDAMFGKEKRPKVGWTNQ